MGNQVTAKLRRIIERFSKIQDGRHACVRQFQGQFIVIGETKYVFEFGEAVKRKIRTIISKFRQIQDGRHESMLAIYSIPY